MNKEQEKALDEYRLAVNRQQQAIGRINLAKAVMSSLKLMVSAQETDIAKMEKDLEVNDKKVNEKLQALEEVISPNSTDQVYREETDRFSSREG